MASIIDEPRGEVYKQLIEYAVNRCHKDVIPILQNASDGLYSWKLPRLPEDLCFDLKDGTPWLDICFHMNIKEVNDSDEEIKKLYNTIKGLGIVGEFNDSLEMILKDTKERNLSELWLGEFDIDELINLQSLTLGENKIENIPKEISNLKNLEVLAICEKNIKDIPEEIKNMNCYKSIDIQFDI